MATDLQKVKSTAKALLFLEPQKTPMSPIVVKHPFTDSGIVGIKDETGVIKIIDILTTQENLKLWRKQVGDFIDRAKSVTEIFYIVTNSYKMGFQYTKPYLDKEEFADLLAHAWINTESPNNDPNISKKEMLALFNAADPAAFMDQQELSRLAKLPDIVTVYRGVTSHNANDIRMLSWTLDYKVANWFAHRFKENGAVYRASISKKHIVALFEGRNESEVIVDPKYLKNIEMIKAP